MTMTIKELSEAVSKLLIESEGDLDQNVFSAHLVLSYHDGHCLLSVSPNGLPGFAAKVQNKLIRDSLGPVGSSLSCLSELGEMLANAVNVTNCKTQEEVDAIKKAVSAAVENVQGANKPLN